MEPLRTSKHVANVTYAVRDVVAWAQQAAKEGKEIISLNIGDPCLFDFRTPDHVLDAIIRGLEASRTSYTPSEGLPVAIEAIRKDAEERKRIGQIQHVLIGHGASEPIEILLTALLDAGDEVLVPQPGYPLYQAVLAKLGAVSVPYDLDETHGWQPNPQEMAPLIGPRTRALVLINPNNPTGSVTSRETLLQILDLAERHRLVVLSDEIYDRILLDSEIEFCATAALRPDLPIATFGGLSKVWLGPGLRLGWSILSGPEVVVRPLAEAMSQLARARLCASHPVQLAVPAALQGPTDHIAAACAKLRRRRDITMRRLSAIPGISLTPPRGAFYAFPRLDFALDDVALTRGLALETGVIVVHGTGFGQRAGTSHLRIVFLPQESLLETAYDRIADYCGGLPRSKR